MGIMDTPRKSKDQEQLTELTRRIAELTAEIRALTKERDRTRELHELEDQIAALKREKDSLIEKNDRKIRETEHSTGLLKKQVEAERAQAKKEAELAAQEARLSVREENLKADKDRFAAEVSFQREFMEREVGRLEGLIKEVLARVPKVEVSAGGRASARTRSED